MQLWDAVAAEAHRPAAAGADRVVHLGQRAVAGPRRAGWSGTRAAARLALLRQQLHSWYVGLFCLPVLPGAACGASATRSLGRALAAREGLPRGHWGPGLRRDARARPRALPRERVPRLRHAARRCAPTCRCWWCTRPATAYLTAVLTEDLDAACSDLRVEQLDAGHWVIVTHADRGRRAGRAHVAATDARH